MHTFVSTGMEVYNSLKHVFVGKKYQDVLI